MKAILAELSKHPVSTPLLLNGTIIVGRDIAHAKFKELIDAGKPVPEYLLKHPIYYAGPAKTPKGKASGSFGPTTAGRMDSYVDLLQSKGASMIMIAKGNRSQQVTDACRKYGGFYLGSIGGPAAVLAEENIRKVECLDFPELGMEAVWKIEVREFPGVHPGGRQGQRLLQAIGAVDRGKGWCKRRVSRRRMRAAEETAVVRPSPTRFDAIVPEALCGAREARTRGALAQTGLAHKRRHRSRQVLHRPGD